MDFEFNYITDEVLIEESSLEEIAKYQEDNVIFKRNKKIYNCKNLDIRKYILHISKDYELIEKFNDIVHEYLSSYMHRKDIPEILFEYGNILKFTESNTNYDKIEALHNVLNMDMRFKIASLNVPKKDFIFNRKIHRLYMLDFDAVIEENGKVICVSSNIKIDIKDLVRYIFNTGDNLEECIDIFLQFLNMYVYNCAKVNFILGDVLQKIGLIQTREFLIENINEFLKIADKYNFIAYKIASLNTPDYDLNDTRKILWNRLHFNYLTDTLIYVDELEECEFNRGEFQICKRRDINLDLREFVEFILNTKYKLKELIRILQFSFGSFHMRKGSFKLVEIVDNESDEDVICKKLFKNFDALINQLDVVYCVSHQVAALNNPEDHMNYDCESRDDYVTESREDHVNFDYESKEEIIIKND